MKSLEQIREEAKEECLDGELVLYIRYYPGDKESLFKEIHEFLMERDMGISWYPRLV